jgi:hypothetical protein
MPANGMSERVDRIEQKLDALSGTVTTLSATVDALSASVDARFEQVDKRFEDIDKRFDEVRDHFVEQREYIEFASDRLDRLMSDGFTALERRIADSERYYEQRLTEGLSRLEHKLDQFIDSQSRPTSRATTSRRPRPPKRRR